MEIKLINNQPIFILMENLSITFDDDICDVLIDIGC
jgi:hypothetical protein